ncbi:hypothetical protein HYH03_014548 [Edaphochlamys debaryana]|uniref:EGF-like domain-containing protein n=1 Tax=Edaphochlamys debaryana TaxID=47281 RepID=A0A836BS46_9CHLO|nr:hypothetical protein HYH03_014548 [Edaphochlamys debaryana]|eukprot:KAG2486865.1 hypothetical protein HYH03_014548 [Edaphochlamys debaryana]
MDAARGFRTALAVLVVLAAPARGLPCANNCTQLGTCNEDLGRCDCPRHLDGPACGTALGVEALAARCKKLYFHPKGKWSTNCTSPEHASCLLDCHGRGTCVAGWCHCQPGAYGADCALSTGPGGRPALLPERGYVPRRTGPRVYVYDLPPVMSSWRSEWSLTDRPLMRMLLERLLAAGARVADGDTADWYLLPLVLRGNDHRSWLVKAARHVARAHPWWNATGGGHRHLVLALGDWGRTEVEYARKFPESHITQNITFATYWGLYEDRPCGWEASHRNATDIVLPVMLRPGKMEALGLLQGRLHPAFPELAQAQLRERSGPLLYFAGRICGDMSVPQVRNGSAGPVCASDKNSAYSGGVRQAVHFHHWNRTGFLLRTSDQDYGRHLVTARFCLAPTGAGHGQRQIQAVLAGCVPVLISDGVLQPWEPFLDWGSFGVRVAEADIPRLHEVLEAVGPEEYARKDAALRCAAQHLAYSLSQGASMGESGRFDAFETLLAVLAARARHPGTPPERLRQVDPALDAFLDCREPPEAAATEREPVSAMPLQRAVGGSLGGNGSLEGDGGERTGSVGARVVGEGGAEGGAAAAEAGSGAGAAGTGGGAAAGRNATGAAANVPSTALRPLCSISPFDEGQSQRLPMCRHVYGSWPLQGGAICAYSPRNIAACPRAWD